MKRSLRLITSFLISYFVSASAFACDLSTADTLFTQREANPASIQQARAAYISELNVCSSSERVYAIEQVSRLDVYAALTIPENSIRKRKPLLEHCLQDIERISPDTDAGTTPQYYYWKITCMAYWAEANGIMSSLDRANEILDLIDTGLQVDPNYEGGGFDRAAGVIYSKLPAFNPFGPAGDLPRALEHFEKSLNAPAYVHALHPETETGDYHYPTYYYYAQALVKSGDRSTARHILDNALARIEDGDLPLGREPETNLATRRMRELRAKL